MKPSIDLGAADGVPGWKISPLVTTGDQIGDYKFPNIPDGMGAWSKGPGYGNTIRLLVNHEISFNSPEGGLYAVEGGSLGGARVSYVDIDRESREILCSGTAYTKVYDAAGNPRTSGVFHRFCSGVGHDAGTYGFVDNLFLLGEEGSTRQAVVIDVAGETLHVVPAMGKASYESEAAISNHGSNKVAIIIGDDTGAAFLKLFIGEIGANSEFDGFSNADFLKRNGLAKGRLFAWAADSGEIKYEQGFRGSGTVETGKFFPLDKTCTDLNLVGEALVACKKALYTDYNTSVAAARSLKAFEFNRIEDVSTNPNNGDQLVFAVTSGGGLGTTVTINFEDLAAQLQLPLGDIMEIKANAKIIYDSNESGASSLRDPDNLCWTKSGDILVQEDGGGDEYCGVESSLYIIPNNGMGQVKPKRLATMDRSVTVLNNVDVSSDNCGPWESTGVIDMSDLMKSKGGKKIYLTAVQLRQSGQVLWVEEA